VNSRFDKPVTFYSDLTGTLYNNSAGEQLIVGSSGISGTINPQGLPTASGTIVIETNSGWTTLEPRKVYENPPVVLADRPATIGISRPLSSGTLTSPSLHIKGRNVSFVETFENQNTFSTNFLHNGDANWFLITTGSGYAYSSGTLGNNIIRAGRITHNQSSSIILKRTYDVPVQVKFAYRVSSESGFDFLRFFIDDSQQFSTSGEIGWQPFTSSVVNAGAHVFRWSYSKDSSGNAGLDTAFLDHIEIVDVQASSSLRSALTITSGSVAIGLESAASGVLLHVAEGQSVFNGNVHISGSLTIDTGYDSNVKIIPALHFSHVDNAVSASGGFPSQALGSVTTGVQFVVQSSYPPVVVRGVRFYTALTGSSSVRCKLWNPSNSVVAVTDVATNGPGTYLALFGTSSYTPTANELGRSFYVSTWEKTGFAYTEQSNTLQFNFATPYIAGHRTIINGIKAFGSGDSVPSSTAVSEQYPVEPYLTISVSSSA
jgi:hypothetical protein